MSWLDVNRIIDFEASTQERGLFRTDLIALSVGMAARGEPGDQYEQGVSPGDQSHPSDG